MSDTIHKERLKEIAELLTNFEDPMSEKDYEILSNVADELYEASEEYEQALLLKVCNEILEEDE